MLHSCSFVLLVHLRRDALARSPGPCMPSGESTALQGSYLNTRQGIGCGARPAAQWFRRTSWPWCPSSRGAIVRTRSRARTMNLTRSLFHAETCIMTHTLHDNSHACHTFNVVRTSLSPRGGTCYVTLHLSMPYTRCYAHTADT